MHIRIQKIDSVDTKLANTLPKHLTNNHPEPMTTLHNSTQQNRQHNHESRDGETHQFMPKLDVIVKAFAHHLEIELFKLVYLWSDVFVIGVVQFDDQVYDVLTLFSAKVGSLDSLVQLLNTGGELDYGG